MVKAQTLNVIIILCVGALVAIFLAKPKINQPTTQIVQKPILSPTATPTPTDVLGPLTSCLNSYFPINVGDTYTYSSTMQQSKTSENEKLLLTLKVVSLDESSAVFETTINTTNAKALQKITCRKSGIYGLPFAATLFTEKKKVSQFLDINSSIQTLLNSHMLVPSEGDIIIGHTWDYPIALNLGGNLGNSFKIDFDVSGQIKKVMVMSKGAFKNFPGVLISQEIRPIVENVQIPLPDMSVHITTTIAQNIGIVEYAVESVGIDKNKGKIVFILESYKKAQPTSNSL